MPRALCPALGAKELSVPQSCHLWFPNCCLKGQPRAQETMEPGNAQGSQQERTGSQQDTASLSDGDGRRTLLPPDGGCHPHGVPAPAVHTPPSTHSPSTPQRPHPTVHTSPSTHTTFYIPASTPQHPHPTVHISPSTHTVHTPPSTHPLPSPHCPHPTGSIPGQGAKIPHVALSKQKHDMG